MKNFLKFNRTKFSDNKGFSLMEIMFVIGIMGAILALILPKINEARDNSAIKQTRIKLSEIENKINDYQAECGKLPTSLEFMIKDTSDCNKWTSNKNSKNLMNDEWNVPFVYEPSANGFNLKSFGKNKKEGGEGPDKDIYSQGSEANAE
jgi:general secretion pathway protein G